MFQFQCVICMNLCDEKLTSPVSTICGHIFHEHCIRKWFHSQQRFIGNGTDQHGTIETKQGESSCPICKTLVTSTPYIKIYPIEVETRINSTQTFGYNENFEKLGTINAYSEQNLNLLPPIMDHSSKIKLLDHLRRSVEEKLILEKNIQVLKEENAKLTKLIQQIAMKNIFLVNELTKIKKASKSDSQSLFTSKEGRSQIGKTKIMFEDGKNQSFLRNQNEQKLGKICKIEENFCKERNNRRNFVSGIFRIFFRPGS